jgi:hypothetical protein
VLGCSGCLKRTRSGSVQTSASVQLATLLFVARRFGGRARSADLDTERDHSHQVSPHTERIRLHLPYCVEPQPDQGKDYRATTENSQHLGTLQSLIRVDPSLDALKKTCPAHGKRGTWTDAGKSGHRRLRLSYILLTVGRCWTISDSFSLLSVSEGKGSVPAEELATQLNRLRARAGNPSVREIAKLTERQAPGNAMSRSTVQDKISGKSLPRLGQVLAIVRACADYARSIGVPLAAEDTDEQAWRERVEDASARPSSPSPAVAVGVTSNGPATWDLDPLYHAGMHDMIDLVQASAGQPMAGWFLPLIEALALAKMPNLQFLKTASGEAASDLVESLTGLATFDMEDALNSLLNLCSRNQPAESIPVILVLLRRKDDEYRLAERLISVLSGEHTHWFSIRRDIVKVVLALRRATLEKDANQLIEGIGKNGDPRFIFETAVSLQDILRGGNDTILRAVGKGGHWHLAQVLKALRVVTIEGINPKVSLDTIIFGIPTGKHEEVASYLARQALKEEADRCLELKDEPPF